MTEKELFKPGNRKFISSIGRRKRSIAQLRLFSKGTGQIVVNEMNLVDYFRSSLLEQRALESLKLTNLLDTSDAIIKVSGGGKKGQADAIRLAFARALIAFQEELRPQIKKAGLLTRDPRVKERKKYGLKRARKAPQWSKR